MHRLLVRRPSPAMVVALVALFVALAGGAYAAFKLPPNSVGAKQLKKDSITSAKVKEHSLLANDFKPGQAPTGPQGPKGDLGPQGPKGDRGPQGPGATTLTYDASASASPTPTPVGTVLGDTFSADCSIPGAGEAKLTVYIVTSDGSLKWDLGSERTDNGANESFASNVDVAAGTITSPLPVAEAVATAGGSQSDHNSEIVQLSPESGYLNVHTAARTTTAPATQTCHLSILAFPSN